MTRRAALIATATTGLLAVGATPAAADQSPAFCTSNSVDLTVSKSRTLVRNGDTIDYRVRAVNSEGLPCDLTEATVVLRLPAADGTPTGREVVLDSNADYLANMPEQVFAAVSYTVAVDPGVEDIVVEATVNGTLHDAPRNHAARIVKTLGTTVTQPHATLTKTATPDHGQAPLTVTYSYLVTNDSSTNVSIRGATVTDDKCAPLIHTGGDTDDDGLIDVGEAWAFVCTQIFDVGDTIVNTATATGRSSVDGRLIPIPPAQATVRVEAPPTVTPPTVTPPTVTPPTVSPPTVNPPNVTPPTTVTVPPTTPPAGGVLGKTFTLVPVKSKQAAKDAPCISVPKRLSVRAGELTVVRVRVRKEMGQSLSGAVVRITGPGFVDKKTTNAEGEATFRVRSKRAGTLVIQSNRCLGADRVGVLGARKTRSRQVPRVTG